MRMTVRSIQQLTAPQKGQKVYFDDSLAGFGVRVSQGGAKSFVIKHGTGRTIRTIGRFPAMSLSEARIEAKRIQAELSIQPDARMVHVPRVRFSEARDRFIADCEVRNKPRTVRDYRRLLNRHFSFDTRLEALTRTDIMRAINKLAATPVEQQHAAVAVRIMLNWCVRQGLLEHSPVPAIKTLARTRDHVLTENELATVYRTARRYPYPFGHIVSLLILTGQRRGEIANLRWDWIDEHTITLPGTITKNGRIHAFPVGDGTAAVLRAIPTQGELLFPSRVSHERPWSGWGKTKARFDDSLEDVRPYTLHDIRRTYSSTMARLGVPIHVTEKLLNHVSGTISGIAAVYNRHTYQEEMREAVVAYEEHLATLCAD